MRTTFAFVLSLAASATAAPTTLASRAGRTSAPEGCLSVGGSGEYKTVQSAVDALDKSSTSEQCIFIAKGIYNEQILVNSLKSPLTIYGETTDTSGYAGNVVTITQGKSQDDGLTNEQTATLRASTPNLKVYNVNLVNTRGKGSQAVALSANADKQGYYGCQFLGFQDTVLAQVGNQVYAKCYIEGATDFIFGQKAVAWFDRCDIGVLDNSIGYITANGRDSDSNPSYYVINNSKVAAAKNNTVKSGVYYLGRPWRNYARVVFQQTSMTDVIRPVGWKNWNNDDPRTDKVTFAEYKNTGNGSKGDRASFSRQLDAAVSISAVLGNTYKDWVDVSYLS
ncbi:carbohydrate esterase family 8 protein [Stemphylium lycopersici]|uniref:Pectinesterase n=1 Tax=Stemphylium lycopersici TaxID=183478 RepID=A0A364NBW8_STELY|nr:carbohydrate esterase family 8 protein [Stemphylium lycopersici]RAR14854.1 carbohydrate esterase family 8 protein [Stemphylium lycopersici]